MRHACWVMASGLMVGIVAPVAAHQGAQPPSREVQIAQAVQAAPEDRRAGAAVIGFVDGKPTPLRPGSNDLVCLADNPAVDGFSVACYHKDLDAFMARGRALTAQGVTDDQQRDQTRFAEVKAGTLPMPKEPRMLYVTTAKSFDPATGTMDGAYTRWVVYVPFATAESTGLQTRPGAAGVPWLMDPGTAGAHIMISPARP